MESQYVFTLLLRAYSKCKSLLSILPSLPTLFSIFFHSRSRSGIALWRISLDIKPSRPLRRHRLRQNEQTNLVDHGIKTFSVILTLLCRGAHCLLCYVVHRSLFYCMFCDLEHE